MRRVNNEIENVRTLKNKCLLKRNFLEGTYATAF